MAAGFARSGPRESCLRASLAPAGIYLTIAARVARALVDEETGGQDVVLSSVILDGVPDKVQRLCLLVMLGIAVYNVFDDRDRLGLALALERAVVALLSTWALHVPLGPYCRWVLHASGTLTKCGIGASCAFGCWWHFRGLRRPLSMAVVIASCAYVVLRWNSKWVESTLGTVLLFPAVYILVRRVLDFLEDGLMPAWKWPEAEPVPKNSEEFNSKMEEFRLACAAYADKYHYSLEVRNLFRVKKGTAGSNSGSLNRTSEGRHLFHGTRLRSAQMIVKDGFNLPHHAGMFGKGIYFADCPLKSWGYVDRSGLEQKGIILMCWVELGRSKHKKAAHHGLTRPPRRSFIQWLRGEERYASVVGDTKEIGGSLRVPEYVIYDPKQCEVDYICEVVARSR